MLSDNRKGVLTMAAGNKRAKRVEMRKRDHAHTGVMRKAKKDKFDTGAETDVVARDIGGRKKFHLHDIANIQPLNDKQADFMQAYFQGSELMMATGPAGTSKSFSSLFCALTDVLDPSTPQEKLIIARSAVATRDQGFLKGSLEEKEAIFELPYAQICKELLPAFKDPYSHLKSLGYLEFMSTSYLRGLTFHDAVIIVDEYASCDYHELSTIITRVGENSKIIFAGDIKQSDLNSRREESGYKKFMHVVSKMPQASIAHIEYGLEDIVRSGLVKDFLIADYYDG